MILVLAHFFIVFIAFMLMLLVMTFNYGVVISVVTGLAVGNLVFSLMPVAKLPMQYRYVGGKPPYMPEADLCCSPIEEN